MDTKKVCAPSHPMFSGREIERHKERVKKLQMRMVKAVEQQRYNKVRALQWLLTHSYSAKILAVHKVTTKGKKTPGVDGVTWKSPEQKEKAVKSLKRKGYKASPLRRIYISKKNGKKRPLGIPTMQDRAQQALYLMALDPVAETILDNGTYGFRKKRSTADAIEAIFKATAANADCAEWILEGDIRSCFDEISHDWLLEHIPTDKRMLKEWLKAGFIFEGSLHETKKGAAQGGIISPCIAGLALNGLGSRLEKKIKPVHYVKGKSVYSKIHTIAYADDFVVTGKSCELLEEQVLPEIRGFLEERGLELSLEKTKITHIGKGFDFLGQNIRKYKKKVLIKPSKGNAENFLERIRQEIKSHKMVKQEELIAILNPKIRGWANYHRHVVSKETYSYVDYQIYKSIWKWCRRRHNKKGKWWISEKYFHREGNRNWIFEATTGNEKTVRLLMSGRKALNNIWKGQKGKCTLCMEGVVVETGWRTHRNGKGKTEIVHPECHRKLHPELQLTTPVLVLQG